MEGNGFEGMNSTGAVLLAGVILVRARLPAAVITDVGSPRWVLGAQGHLTYQS